MRYWGPDFIAAINAMRMPKFAFGGQLGSSAANRLSIPRFSGPQLSMGKPESRTPLVLDFGKLGKAETSAAPDVEEAVLKIFKRAALQYGRR